MTRIIYHTEYSQAQDKLDVSALDLAASTQQQLRANSNCDYFIATKQITKKAKEEAAGNHAVSSHSPRSLQHGSQVNHRHQSGQVHESDGPGAQGGAPQRAQEEQEAAAAGAPRRHQAEGPQDSLCRDGGHRQDG